MPPKTPTPRIAAAQLFQQPVPASRLPRFARHPLSRILLAVLFLAPVVLVNNLLTYAVLEQLDETLLDILQPIKVVLFIALLMMAYRAYCRRIEGRRALEIGGGGWAQEFGAGAAVGAGMVAVVVGLLAACGAYGVESLNPPSVLVARLFRYGQGAFIEDLLFTVILFRLLEEFGGTVAAYILVSLLFGFMHLGNDNATPATSLFIAVQEITLLAPFILTRRIWMAWAVHFSWNYSQTAVAGLSNSGLDQGGFVTPVVSGPDWLTGGEFGIEASFLALAVNLAVGVPLLVLAYRRRQFVAPSWVRARGATS